MCLKENQKHLKTKLITKSIYISDYQPYKQKQKTVETKARIKGTA